MQHQNETTFFSYSRNDSEFVLKLAKDLRNAGADIWLDQMDIKPGAHWDTAIEAALREAHHLIVVLSPDSVNSNNVMDEVSFALENNKSVMPVLIRNCTIPFRLRRLQYVNFTSSYENGLEQLIEVLGRQTTQQPADDSTQSNIAAKPVSENQTPITGEQKPPMAVPPLSEVDSSAEDRVSGTKKVVHNPDKEMFDEATASPLKKKRNLIIGGAAIFAVVVIWIGIEIFSGPSILAGSQTAETADSNTEAVADTSDQEQTSPPEDLSIGNEYGGGYVFYIDATRKHGLIAAADDILDTTFSDSIAELKATEAVKKLETMCREKGGGGYSDWRMPVDDELRRLYRERKSIPNLQLTEADGTKGPFPYYYSSTTNMDGYVFSKDFSNGKEYNDNISDGRVRPVRSF